MTSCDLDDGPRALRVEREVVHVADATGERCTRCGADLVPEGAARWAARARVVVFDGSAAWPTQRRPTCAERRP